jgi:2-succinyl-5-enolpyruvyl-6-hydroxy-3-cyclohexene-1-carboxylate synthase
MEQQEAHGQHILMRALVDELARCGVAGACTSPGSRSTPIVVPLVRDPRIRCWSHVDERSGAFFALGLAKATGQPVVLACTSGTAAANYAPAVHEAREAGVPLIVLTADRPPELRDVGAGQVIDQVKLFGAAAKWFVEVGNHDATHDRVRWMRSLACRAVWTALDGRPGVVHLNVPLRDPLVPPVDLPEPVPAGREGGGPWLRPSMPPESPAATGLELASQLRGHARGVIVVGRRERFSPIGVATERFAARIGWPVLSDPLGGARCGTAAIAHYDAILRDPAFADAHRPDVVLRMGDLPTSKPLRQWLAALADVPHVAFEPAGVWHDPAGVVGTLVRGDPAMALAAVTQGALGPEPDPPFLPSDRLAPAPPDWLDGWQAADAAAELAVTATLRDGLSEPGVARELGATLDGEDTLVVASSMPVRDVEAFWPVRRDPPRVLGNRGANGIDGTISTAYGVAASGARTVLLVGDVAFAHDVGGLLAGRRYDLPLTIVLLNNDGGGIFETLAISGEPDVYEEHVATPHGLDFAHAAALYGCRHVVAQDLAALRAELAGSLRGGDGTTIIEVRTERRAGLALRRRVWDAVSRPAPAAAPPA